MLARALFLILAAVLLASVAVGLRDVNRSASSHSVVPEPTPVATGKLGHLLSEAADNA